MWSDNDIDNAFQRLNPPDPEPTPFPLDAWLRLESELDKAEVAQTVRRKMWKFFAAEMLIVCLVSLTWLLWKHEGPAVASKVDSAVTSAATSVSAAPGNATAAAHAAASSPATPAPNTDPARVSQASVAALASPSESTSTPDALPEAAGAAPASVATAPELRAVSAAATPGLLVANEPPKRERNTNEPLATEKRGRVTLHSALVAAAPSHQASRVARRSETGFTYSGQKPSAFAPSAVRNSTQPDAARRTTGGSKLMGESPTSSTLAGAASRPDAATSSSTSAEAGLQKPALAETGSARATNAATESVTSIGNDNASLAQSPVSLTLEDASKLPGSLSPVAVASAPKPDVPRPAQRPRFYVGLVGAPDVTTVKFASIESPLPNVGLTLEYRLTDRLRVNTGLLRSKKQYQARRKDCDFGEYAVYVQHRYFDDVDGTCTVLDVPLNLRYDVLSGPNHVLYASTGLSSFFMQRETYSYAFTENYKPGYWQGEAVNANRHLFSILNLSAGYERMLGQHWSLQAEPYVKIPLAGVGAYKLKLTSAGVFLGVKYGF